MSPVRSRWKKPVSPDASTSKVPFIITLAALLLYFAFQTLQMVVERGNLGMMKANQEGCDSRGAKNPGAIQAARF